MVNRNSDFFLDAHDLGFQRGHARLKLPDREWIEILTAERGDRVVRALGQEIFRIHCANVDPKRAAVNKPHASLTKR